jgi:hypothetical protein
MLGIPLPVPPFMMSFTAIETNIEKVWGKIDSAD